MPSFGDIASFMAGQAFGRPTLPPTDLEGKTIIVTGSNTGLGFECVRHLIRMNTSKVIIACRNTAKGESAKSQILASLPPTPPSKLEVWEVDLSSYTSVTSFNARVATLPRLDGFIANAGVELTSFTTFENLETTLTVNVVSTYLSALGALPILHRTGTQHNTTPTLSIIGSLIHTFAPTDQLPSHDSDNDILASLSDLLTADMTQRYPLSKLLAHLAFGPFTQFATSKYPGVSVNLVNPGWCASELGRHKTMSMVQNLAFSVMGRSTEVGSRTLVHGITAGVDSHGRYLSECYVKEQSSFVGSEDGKRVGERLWRELMGRFKGLGVLYEKV